MMMIIRVMVRVVSCVCYFEGLLILMDFVDGAFVNVCVAFVVVNWSSFGWGSLME